MGKEAVQYPGPELTCRRLTQGSVESRRAFDDDPGVALRVASVVDAEQRLSSAPRSRSRRSPGCTATSPRATPVKIFPNDAFGYQRITVERPLRLRWEVNEETSARLAESKQWVKLSDDEQSDLTERLGALVGTTTTDWSTLAKKLGSVPKSIEKPLWDILGVADPDAPIVTKRKGVPEPDPNLRDNENVPLPTIRVTWADEPDERLACLQYRSAIDEYMAAEVLPYVPDAWVDHTKTKLGYEIPWYSTLLQVRSTTTAC
jgi:type I restriction enzyme M protein